MQYTLGTITLPVTAKQYVGQVLATRRLSYGPFCERFEKLFAELHDSKHAVLCSSGTAGLHTILTALKITHGWQDGDEVLVPAVTFVATLNAVIHSGLRPVLVDIQPDTYNLDPALILAKITPKTRAIMPVHLFGKAAAMAEISAIAEQQGLVVIEDSCEALLATSDGKKVGSWGEAAAFSTHSAHILTTGIGGFITTNNSALADLMRSLINHGRDTDYISIDDDNELSERKLQKVVAARFNFKHVGFSYRISELEAAVGLAQLEVVEKTIAKRRRNCATLNKQLKKLDSFLQLPVLSDSDEEVFMAYPLVLQPALANQDPTLLQKLILYLENAGIETRPFFPIIGQPAYAEFSFKQSDYPVAARCTAAGFYIGCHQELKRAELTYCVQQLEAFFAEHSP